MTFFLFINIFIYELHIDNDLYIVIHIQIKTQTNEQNKIISTR